MQLDMWKAKACSLCRSDRPNATIYDNCRDCTRNMEEAIEAVVRELDGEWCR